MPILKKTTWKALNDEFLVFVVRLTEKMDGRSPEHGV